MQFSVIIPLYNKAHYIRRAIKSVLSQKHNDFEIIVVDDGSTDEGLSIVKKYRNSKILVFHQDNMGVSAARNCGIKLARGEFIAFLDADDEWSPDFLVSIDRLIKLFPGGGIYATGYQFNLGKSMIKKPVISNFRVKGNWRGYLTNYFANTLKDSIISASSAVVPSDVFRNIGYFPENIDFGEDLEMWFDIACSYPIVYDSSIQVDYNFTSNDRACSKPHFDVLSVNRKAVEYLKRNNLLIEERNAIRKMIVKYNILICKYNIKDGNPIKARDVLLLLKPKIWEYLEWYFCYMTTFLPLQFIRFIRI